MQKIYTLLFLIAGISFSHAQTPLTFHDYSGETIIGDTINFSQFYGKKVLVVNTASYCVFTPQYEQLQELYEQYQQYNFEIIGFPCNDFNDQEPGNDSDIIQTCEGYNVTFQMMSKVEVITGDTAPVYKWLQRADLNGVSNAHVAWNFNKFLIDEAGHWVNHLQSSVSPTSPTITNWIMTPSVVSSAPSLKADDVFEMRSANPANSSIDFFIKNAPSNELQISLYSAEGKWIDAIYNGTASNSQSISYSTSNLQSGIYIVQVRNGQELRSQRVVVMK